MYPHRDESDAAEVVDTISAVVPSLAGQRVLDLACGPGRHTVILREREAHPVGLDLSITLLRQARSRHFPPIPVVRGDMRMLPLRDRSFDLVVNLFTSFGYFDSDDQHAAVLSEVARVLVRDGWFVLDYLNASRVRQTLVEYEDALLGGRRVEVKRRISEDGKYVFKEMKLVGEGRSYQERVRLFEIRELERLIASAGFAVREKFGSYQGDSLDDNSPRALFFSVSQ